jgi:hypothetical protein
MLNKLIGKTILRIYFSICDGTGQVHTLPPPLLTKKHPRTFVRGRRLVECSGCLSRLAVFALGPTVGIRRRYRRVLWRAAAAVALAGCGHAPQLPKARSRDCEWAGEKH